MNEIDREAKPIVYDWPVGYCDNTTHWGTEHPLYTSSDNGCTNFVTSERLLEIKQLFDQAAQLVALRDERDRAVRVLNVLGMGLRFTDVFVRTRSWVFSTSDFAPGDFDLLRQLIESEEVQ